MQTAKMQPFVLAKGLGFYRALLGFYVGLADSGLSAYEGLCVCVCVNHLCAKVSFFCLSINQGSLHLQGAEAPIQTPLLTKLVCMW